MTSEAQTNDKPDFSNYTWFPGVKDKYNAASVSVFEDRVFLGLKGYDKKAGSAGYIQAEFDYEQLGALHARLGELLVESAEVEA